MKTNLLLMSLLCAASCASEKPKPYEYGIPNLALVTNGVWRGGQPTNDAAWNYLLNVGVSNVIKLNTDSEGADEVWNPLAVRRFPITLNEQVDPLAGAGLDRQVRGAVEAIKPGTFIHCEHGQDRTGLVVAMYRLKCGWSKADAQKEMINLGFHRILTGLWTYWNDAQEFAIKSDDYVTNRLDVIGDSGLWVHHLPITNSSGNTNELLWMDGNKQLTASGVTDYMKSVKVVTNVSVIDCDFASSRYKANGSGWSMLNNGGMEGSDPQGQVIKTQVVEVTESSMKIDGEPVQYHRERVLSESSVHMKKRITVTWEKSDELPNFTPPPLAPYYINSVMLTNQNWIWTNDASMLTNRLDGWGYREASK